MSYEICMYVGCMGIDTSPLSTSAFSPIAWTTNMKKWVLIQVINSHKCTCTHERPSEMSANDRIRLQSPIFINACSKTSTVQKYICYHTLSNNYPYSGNARLATQIRVNFYRGGSFLSLFLPFTSQVGESLRRSSVTLNVPEDPTVAELDCRLYMRTLLAA